jgi:LysR family transcriptional regulator, transcriptional activator for dmlA
MSDSAADDAQFFATVSTARSLTAAARELGTSVSTVSKRLSRLEARLGTRLVARTTRSFSLTSEGERYALGAKRIASDLVALEDSLSDAGEPAGRIRVQTSAGIGRHHISPLVGEFCARHRRVQVDVQLSPLPLGAIESSFDVGIRVGSIHDSRLTAKRLCHNTRIVCAAPDYVRRHGRPEHPSELSRHNCLILRENDGDYALWRFGADGAQSVRVDGSLSSNDGDVITQWCVDGHGLIMRSSWHVRALLDRGVLVPLLTDHVTPTADVHAVYSATAVVPNRVRSLIGFLAERLPARVDPLGIDAPG